MPDEDEPALASVDGLESVRRQVRQRLEALGRSGVARIPRTAVVGTSLPDRASASISDAEPSVPGPIESLPAAKRPTSLPVAPPARPLPTAPAPTEERFALGSNPVPAKAPIMPAPPRLPRHRRSLFDDPEVGTAPATEYGPPVPQPERPAALEVIAREVAVCTRCPALVANRTKTVPGEGNPSARLVFMGEAPGADEDRTGRPFVGRAGLLLNDMITKGMGLRREDVFILNAIKCRPPENRVPLADEQANCRGYLERQLATIRPEFLCLLGKTAAVAILDVDPTASMGKVRGRWFDFRGIRTMVTYHPAYLLRTPAAKKDAWEDLKFLMSAMGLEPPARG
jgi:DNA polymerase